MSYEIQGKVVKIEATKQISDRFRKRDIIIEVVSGRNNEYTDLVALQLSQDRCETADRIAIGTHVYATFSIRGREWLPPSGGEPRYFITLNCYRLEWDADTAPQNPEQPEGTPQAAPAGQQAPPPPPFPAEGQGGQGGAVDDIPF